MLRYFEHPKIVCMTYGTHMKLSLYFAFLLAKGSVQAVVHAFLPDTFITSTGDLTKKLHGILKVSGCDDGDKDE